MDDDFGGFDGGGGGDAPSTTGDDDFGGFGGGGETARVTRYSNTRIGSFKGHNSSSSQSSQPAAPIKRTRGSMRTGMYAKSPMQRREEAAAAAEYQAALQAEQDKQSGAFGGFGDEIIDDEPKQEANKQNVWGQAPNAVGIVIPPFVPRSQRNARLWDAGKIKKSQSDKAVLAATHGMFLIRETMKGDRHVVCVNDQGGLFEMYIKHLPGGRFTFMSREFDDLADIVKHLQRNALYNKQGLPLYVDKPISINK